MLLKPSRRREKLKSEPTSKMGTSKLKLVEISDTGQGILAKTLDRIFNPGFTTKGAKVGVGLRLAICYKIIVDEHKGYISVSSEVEKGTTFIIVLPSETGKPELRCIQKNKGSRILYLVSCIDGIM